MINALDRALLDLARKVARKYRELTGRDNFSLGHVFNGVWFFVSCFVIWRAPAYYEEPALLRHLFFALAALVVARNAFDIFLFEREAEENALRGAVRKLPHEILRRQRISWFLLAFLLWAMVIPLHFARLSSVGVFLAMACVPFVVVGYLCSIDRPPYSRVRLTNFFRKLAPSKVRC